MVDMNTEVISVRVRKEVKRALLEKKVDLSKLVNAYLEQLAQSEKSKGVMLRLEEIIEKRVKPSKRGFAVRSVREDRYATH